MNVSRVFMVLSLAVLVYIPYTTVTENNEQENLDNTLKLEFHFHHYHQMKMIINYQR